MHFIEEKYRLFLDSVRSSLEKKGHEVEGLVWTRDKSPKTQYQTLLISLRGLLRKNNWHNDSFVVDFVEAWFNVSLDEFCSSTVKSFGDGEGESWVERLKNRRQAIVDAPVKRTISPIKRELLRAKDIMNLYYDPYYQGNLPYVLFNIGKVRNIRLGSPTSEKHPFCKAEIIPEFRAFIEMYALKGKKHLFINLQKRQKKEWFSRYFGIWNETHRVSAIEALQQEYPETISVVTLPFNSEFYYRENYTCKEEFKKLFLKEVFAENSDFYLPQISYEELSNLLDEIKSNHDYISLFYCRLQEYLIEKLGVDSYNVSCRDSIDRGACANALMYVYKGHNPLEHYDKIESLLLAPALLVRRRAIQKHRFDRFLFFY